MKPLFAFGDLVLDVVARVDSQLESDTDTPGEVVSAPGGSAANFAVWSARLGQPTQFAARVGADMLGRALAADMEAEGVEAHIAMDAAHPTAVLVLFAEGSKRHMMVPLGANHFLEPDDLPLEALRNAGWLHVTGYSYFWEATARTVRYALEVARRAGIPVSFDPSSAGFIRRKGLAMPKETQVLMPNLEEAQALTGHTDPQAAAAALGETAPLVAVKLGPDGALLCERGNLVYVPPSHPDGPVVDATGAGDAWGAAFVYGLRLGHSPVEAAQRANRLGAWLVTRMGARPAGIPFQQLF